MEDAVGFITGFRFFSENMASFRERSNLLLESFDKGGGGFPRRTLKKCNTNECYKNDLTPMLETMKETFRDNFTLTVVSRISIIFTLFLTSSIESRIETITNVLGSGAYLCSSVMFECNVQVI